MSKYAEIIADFHKKRENVALFRKVDLHFHSPCSYDHNAEKPSAYPEILTSVDLDMLAITDHMKCGFACQICSSFSSSNLCVLPGMEVNFRPEAPWNHFKLHLITIFPSTHSVDMISRMLPGSMDGEETRSGKAEINDMELKNFIKDVHDCGGLCIAAHVDSNRGIRRAFKQLGRDSITFDTELTDEEERRFAGEFKDWIFDAEVDALEVASANDKRHYCWRSELHGRTLTFPALLASDAHSIEDLRSSKKKTFIKMTDVSFEGLKQALKFPDTRIRFPLELPERPSPRILGLQIEAGDDEGFFQDIRLAFSDNLNCLIGPRGSGKSTVIEALRYVFGYNKNLNQIEDSEADLADKIRSLQKATLSNCVIRVVYCMQNGEKNIIEATYDSKQDYTTRIYTEEGEDRQIADVRESEDYPLRLFSWSEVETLGREPHRQRELLDRLISDLPRKLNNRNKLRTQLAKKRQEIESCIDELDNIASRNRSEIEKYTEYKADFDRLNTDQARKLFAGVDLAKSKEVILEKIKQNISDWTEGLQTYQEAELTQGIEELLQDASGDAKEWWNKKKQERDLRGKQSDAANLIRKATDILKDLSRDIIGDVKKLKQDIREKDKSIREEISEEAAKQVPVEHRRIAGKRLQRVEGLRREYNQEWQRLGGFIEDWKEEAEKLKSLQKEISGERITKKEEIEIQLNEFCAGEMRVSLRFIPSGDRSYLENKLKDGNLLNRDDHGQYKAQRWPEKIAANNTPVELAEALLAKTPSRLVGQAKAHDDNVLEVDEDMAKRLTDTLYPFDEDENVAITRVDKGKLTSILKIGEIEWDDEEGVLLNEKPVDRLSPGQRSSAMLPLIALTEEAPLVIDQPEDNLDNRLVGKMLVDILAKLKEKRQIIVTTHNPNIVVLGDAEQVIVLDAINDSEGKCSLFGSIDKEDIVKSIMKNMEGGRNAFITRQKRYRL